MMKQNKPRKYKTLSQNNAMIASYAISQWEINERKKVRIVDCLPNKFKQDLDGIKYKPDIYYSFVVLSYGASVSVSPIVRLLVVVLTLEGCGEDQFT